ncbi:hypothetical protein EYC80_001113 [Monilinia laxa]|uniref:C3H1-type domain-containing protein n=1 Tax=Monilinia laxa TaxID=61186 RepID=A0A5N6K893_MONLA|nr:hypothetical protein EYC80_001113 [Monilinia laxa]
MELSNFTAKALEKVEKYSLILYATGYFTQEEWVKHDALLHKGKYVFTKGPQASLPIVMGPTIGLWKSNARPATREESRPKPQNETEESLINSDEDSGEKVEAALASINPIDVSTTNNTGENGQEGGSEATASLIKENIRSEDETTAPANLDEPVTVNQEQESAGSDGPVEYLPKDTLGNENSTKSPASASPAKPKLPLKVKVKKESTESLATPKARTSKTELSRAEEERRIKLFTKAFGRPPSAKSDYHQPTNPEFKPRWLGESSTDSTPSTRSTTNAHSKKPDASRNAMKKSGGFSMNDYERKCTAEWENDSEENGPSFRLDHSRFAVLADMHHQSSSRGTESDSTVSSQKNGQNRSVIRWQSSIDTMVDSKELQITEGHLNKSKNSPLHLKSTGPKLTTRERLRNKPLEIVVPKTEVCYFWAVGDRCRYPEALCRDLHEDREYTLQTNVRDGKPNPGPLCEVIDPIPAPPSDGSHAPAQDLASTVGKRFTCFFWHQGGCWKSERECYFLHTYVGSEGILHRKVQTQAHINTKRALIAKPKFEDTNEDSVDAEWGASEFSTNATSGAEPELLSPGHDNPVDEEEQATLEPGTLKWPENQPSPKCGNACSIRGTGKKLDAPDPAYAFRAVTLIWDTTPKSLTLALINTHNLDIQPRSLTTGNTARIIDNHHSTRS